MYGFHYRFTRISYVFHRGSKLLNRPRPPFLRLNSLAKDKTMHDKLPKILPRSVFQVSRANAVEQLSSEPKRIILCHV